MRTNILMKYFLEKLTFKNCTFKVTLRIEVKNTLNLSVDVNVICSLLV
jgi:hypothetical protein